MVCGQHHAPAPLPPGNTRYPLYRRLGGPQGRYGWVRKISAPPAFDPRTVQPVASRYTDELSRPAIRCIRYNIYNVDKGKLEIQCHAFLTSALDGNDWSVSIPDQSTPGWRAFSTGLTGSSVGPEAGVDPVQNRKLRTHRTRTMIPPLSIP